MNPISENEKTEEPENDTWVEEVKDGTNRYYQRMCSDQLWHRFIIVGLPGNNPKHYSRFMSDSDIISKVSQECKLQDMIESEFVIRNLKINFLVSSVIFIQEDYHCLGLSARIKLFECIVLGVKDLHEHLICHRSLSPISICIVNVDGNYMAKINCFDTAIRFGNKSFTMTDYGLKYLPKIKHLGSFIAPELKKEQLFGLTADIWSLGVLFNYIINGTCENIDLQENGQIKIVLPTGTPNWLSKLLYSMLDPDPHNRCDTNTILDIIKVSFKCLDVIERQFELDSKELLVDSENVKNE